MDDSWENSWDTWDSSSSSSEETENTNLSPPIPVPTPIPAPVPIPISAKITIHSTPPLPVSSTKTKQIDEIKQNLRDYTTSLADPKLKSSLQTYLRTSLSERLWMKGVRQKSKGTALYDYYNDSGTSMEQYTIQKELNRLDYIVITSSSSCNNSKSKVLTSKAEIKTYFETVSEERKSYLDAICIRAANQSLLGDLILLLTPPNPASEGRGRVQQNIIDLLLPANLELTIKASKVEFTVDFVNHIVTCRSTIIISLPPSLSPSSSSPKSSSSIIGEITTKLDFQIENKDLICSVEDLRPNLIFDQQLSEDAESILKMQEAKDYTFFDFDDDDLPVKTSNGNNKKTRVKETALLTLNQISQATGVSRKIGSVFDLIGGVINNAISEGDRGGLDGFGLGLDGDGDGNGDGDRSIANLSVGEGENGEKRNIGVDDVTKIANAIEKVAVSNDVLAVKSGAAESTNTESSSDDENEGETRKRWSGGRKGRR